MSAKVEGLPGISQRGKRMGVKLAQAAVSAGSLAALIPGAPKSWQPERNLPPSPPRATYVWLFPGVSPRAGEGI